MCLQGTAEIGGEEVRASGDGAIQPQQVGKQTAEALVATSFLAGISTLAPGFPWHSARQWHAIRI